MDGGFGFNLCVNCDKCYIFCDFVVSDTSDTDNELGDHVITRRSREVSYLDSRYISRWRSSAILI